MRLPTTIWGLLTPYAAAISNAACADNSEAISPWQGTGIDLGLFDEKINAARDTQLHREHGAGERFHRLHLQSVVINGVQLLVLITIAAALLWLPLSG